MKHVVVVTGVDREAACLRGVPALALVTGGGDEAGLRRRIEAAADDASAVVSFGMAGALAEDLAVGDWVVADRLIGVVEAECAWAWRDALAAALPGARVGGVFADGRMIATVAEKHALHDRTGALAVDMESHVAAAVAAERGLPFAVVRCISDTAGRALPHAVTVAMRADGGVDRGAVAKSLLAHPRQAFALAGTGWAFFRAMRALQRGAAVIGPLLAAPR